MKAPQSSGPNERAFVFRVDQELGQLVKVYCVLNQKKISCFLTEIIRKELDGFEEKLEEIKAFITR